MSEAKKLFLTDKCCCCFSLETGGYIIGCLGTFASFLWAVYFYSIIKESWGASCEDLKNEYIFDKGFAIFDNCDTAKTASLTFISIFLIILIIDIIVTVIFMIGIKKRCHKLVLPVIIFEIISLAFFFIKQIVKFSKVAFAVAIGFGALSVYFFIIMISLYYKFKDERVENPRYSPAKGTAS